jgi:hypothetical protein
MHSSVADTQVTYKNPERDITRAVLFLMASFHLWIHIGTHLLSKYAACLVLKISKTENNTLQQKKYLSSNNSYQNFKWNNYST